MARAADGEALFDDNRVVAIFRLLEINRDRGEGGGGRAGGGVFGTPKPSGVLRRPFLTGYERKPAPECDGPGLGLARVDKNGRRVPAGRRQGSRKNPASLDSALHRPLTGTKAKARPAEAIAGR